MAAIYSKKWIFNFLTFGDFEYTLPPDSTGRPIPNENLNNLLHLSTSFAGERWRTNAPDPIEGLQSETFS